MIEDLAVWVLRGFGVLYVLGGLFGARAFWLTGRHEAELDVMLDTLDAINAENEGAPAPPKRETDLGRQYWLLAGSLLLIPAGAAMALAHRLAVPLLAVVIVQQLFYFMRQRRRELAAANAEHADEARPAPATVNGFYSCLGVTLLAAWLSWRGALS